MIYTISIISVAIYTVFGYSYLGNVIYSAFTKIYFQIWNTLKPGQRFLT